ncbi:lipopolysaccharide biosynthesis protein [Thermodesulfobacteriota bacterium B35]
MSSSKDKEYSNLFDTSQITRVVGQKSAKAGAANLASQGLSLVITLLRAAILARLLTPADYGVFAMVVVVSSFATIFKDLGLSTATIREKKITHAQVSNLFWINFLVGIVSMMVVWSAAPLMVWFYREPQLAAIARVLSMAFLFSGLSVQHQALLKRQMQFGKIAIITVGASLASSLLGIWIAYIRGNYWALVWMQIAQNCFLMVGFWVATHWIPSLPLRKVGTKKFIKTGVDVAGLNAFSTLTQSVDKILAGRLAGATNLGLYNKGGQIPNLVSGQFRMAFFSVALPALSSLQSENERFASYYQTFLFAICWVTMSLSVFCFVFAEEIIGVYFGPQWVGSVPFMRIFTLHAFLMPSITTLDQIPLALGYSRRYLAGGIVRSIGTIFCVGAGAAVYGVRGIALGVVLANLVTFFPFSRICLKNSPVRLSAYFQTALIPLLITLIIGLIFWIGKFFCPVTNLSLKMFIMTACMLTFCTAFLFCDYFSVGGSMGAARKIINMLHR